MISKNIRSPCLVSVSEIFYSLQGEGRYAGSHSVFVRLGGCNLVCPGFGAGGCDSYYAVNSKYKDSWSRIDGKTAIAEHKKMMKFSHAHTVITGGEPTLWFGNLDFMEFAKYLYDGGHRVTVETNATKEIDFSFEPYRSFVYALSVKLSNSKEPEERRINMQALKNFIAESDYFFKFVLDSDLIKSGRAKQEIEGILTPLGVSPEAVYCMPLGGDRAGLAENARDVFEFCLDNGYSYSDRLHIRIFDKKKGV